MSGNSLKQTVHTNRASVHQAAKLVAALLRVARVTAGLAESKGSLPVYDSHHRQADCQELGSAPEPYAPISSRTLRSVIEYGLPFLLYYACSTVVYYLMASFPG